LDLLVAHEDQVAEFYIDWLMNYCIQIMDEVFVLRQIWNHPCNWGTVAGHSFLVSHVADKYSQLWVVEYI